MIAALRSRHDTLGLKLRMPAELLQVGFESSFDVRGNRHSRKLFEGGIHDRCLSIIMVHHWFSE
jgi:hypothetical protein